MESLQMYLNYLYFHNFTYILKKDIYTYYLLYYYMKFKYYSEKLLKKINSILLSSLP